MRLIAVDIGSLSTKGSLIGDRGTLFHQEVIPHPIESPHAGWAEQDGETVWWQETVQVIRRLLKHSAANQVDGIGITGLFPALLLTDGGGKPLGPALLYADNRARQELEDFNRTFGAGADAYDVAPKLAWLASHDPGTLRQARRFFSSHNFIVYRLTGAYCLDYKVAASYGGLFDARSLTWRHDVAAWAGIEADDLPRLCSAGEIVGHVTQEAAEQTGLPSGTPVIAGSGDSLMTFLSSGLFTRGETLLSFGTTGWAGFLTHDLRDYFADPHQSVQGSPYVLDGYVEHLGSALAWIRDEFFPEQVRDNRGSGKAKPAFRALDQQAASIRPGADGLTVLPDFVARQGPFTPGDAAGIIYGLNLNHSAVHLYRSLLEAFGYIVRLAIERQERHGIQIKRIACTGGGAASAIWRQIVSDIIRRPLEFYRASGPMVGVAYLAAQSFGYLQSLDEIAAWLPQNATTVPALDPTPGYEEGYRRFQWLSGIFGER